MGTDSPNLKDTKAKLDYLKELLTDRNILANDPRTYLHVGKILEKEILRIRSALFATYGINPISESDLPDPEGPKVNLQTKVYMPTDSVNSFNFVGRILGPDGSTAKCLQQCLGVKIMVRGRGSMRDRKKEEANIGKPNWEHLSDRLHVVLTVEDHENRAKARLAKASEYITMFLQESMKGSDKDDKVKQMQLMELSFRREPCSSWRFNCNNLLDINFPQKPGTAIFPNTATNFLNFGYAYQPPLFSPLHHPGSLSSVGNLGAYGQQQQPHHHHQQQQHHHSQQATQPQQQPGQTFGNHLTPAYSHAFSNNLNATAFLLGHSPNSAAGYTSPYSPNSQSAAPGLAVAPMNYWAGQGVGQLTTEYAFAQTTQMNGQHVTEKNEQVLTNQNGTYATEDLMQQYVLTEMNACNLDGLKELTLQDTMTTGETYRDGSVKQPTSTNGTHDNSNDIDTPSDTSTACVVNECVPNGTSNKPSGNRRYSQKHAYQLMQRSGATPGRGGGGRSAVVTVRIASSEQHSPPLNNGDNSKDASAFHVPSKVSTVNVGLSNVGSDTEDDWPKLGTAVEREKGGKNKINVAQAAKNTESPKNSSIGEDGDGL